MSANFDRAESIIEKMKRDDHNMAVFKLAGSYRTCRADGGGFEALMIQKPESVVGVYNFQCPADWLEADLDYAGIK